MEDRLTLLRSSPSYRQVFSLLAQLQDVPPRHCVSREEGFTREAFFERLKPILEPCATGVRVPGHLGNASDRPMPGLDSPGLKHQTESFCGDWSPAARAPGIRSRPPSASEGTSGIRSS